MEGKIYVAPLQQGMSLGEMLVNLAKGKMAFQGAVVVHGDGLWDKEVWESSPRNPSGKRLGELNGRSLDEGVVRAVEDIKLVLYAKEHRERVLQALGDQGYAIMELEYKSNPP